MKKKWKKQISILLCLFLTCTNLYVGNINTVYAQGEGEGAAAAPYDEIYVFDDTNIKGTEYEGKEYCQIEYSGDWKGEGQNNGGAGCYNDTDHWTDSLGATCTITFKGTNLKYYSRTGNFGAADFSVDGKGAENVSFNSDAKNNVFLYDTGILPYGEHVLTITAKGLIVVDRVEVSCPYAVVNDVDEGTEALQLTYGGAWNYEASKQPENCKQNEHKFSSTAKDTAYKEDVHWAEHAGPSLEFKFYGTSVRYYTESSTARVKVSIDGEQLSDNLSMDTGTLNQGLAFNSSDYKALDAGLHTLKMELVSGVLVSDRIEVYCSHKGEEQIVINKKEPLCEEEGYSGDTCYKGCGQKISDGQAVPQKGHSWNAGVVTIEPTEEKDGEKTYTCTNCGKTRTETVSFSCSHENKQEKHKEATCKEAGYKDAYYCPDCQKMISEGTVVEALGHDREVRGQKEASSTEDGYTGDTYCKRCEELLESGEVIPKACAVVNDTVTGTGELQFNYIGKWGIGAGTADCYEGDNHWSDTTDSALEFKFKGTSVKYFSQKGNNLGYAAFSIDGGEEEKINMYQANKQDQVLIYQSPDLQPGLHTLKVRVTGENGAGPGTNVVVADRIEVYCNHKGEETESRDVPATCTQAAHKGETYGKLCGQKISDGVNEGAPLGHAQQPKEDKAATCTEPGYTGQTYCTRCEEIIEQGEVIPALGHEEKIRGDKAATCTEAGNTGETYCERCEEIIEQGEIIPALGHEEESRNIEATCTNPGCSGQIYCTRCDEVVNPGENVAALGHQWDDGTVTTEPTEDTEGIKTFTCTRAGCGGTMAVPLPATGSDDCRHEHTEVKNQAATCTEDGYAGAIYCNDCQKIIYKGEAEKALGHDQEIRDRVEASDTQDGYTGDTYCKRCEILLESGKTIPKAYAVVNDAVLGSGKSEFNFSEGWTYEKADSSIGCYEDDNHWSDTEGAVLTFQFAGTNVKYYAQKAANLGYAAFSIDDGEEKEINLYQEKKENQVLLYESGDLQPGLHTLKVRVTGKAGIEGGTNVVVADKIEVYCSHEGEEIAQRNTATCTQAGNIETFGTVCGQQISRGEPSAALGHEERVRGEKAAGCTTAGHSGETYCARCNEVLNPGKEIPALGHQWDKGVVTKQPTTVKTGEKTYTCTVCKAAEIEVLPKKTAAAPTAPKKGSKLIDASSKAEYKVLSAKVSKGKVTGTVSYVKSRNKSAKVVKVPAKITVNGGTYTVTAIADKAFRNNKKITKITIGNNVRTIGSSVFYNCKKLKTVTLGKKVETIGNKAFGKCTALTKITIPAKVKKIGKQSFAGCKKLKTIIVKTTKLKKSSVGASAFKGISTKATIKVPKSKLKSYRSILRSRGASRKVKIKKV